MVKAALILQGGGAAGSWQAGLLEALIESLAFCRSVIAVIGTSVGGLNGAILVQRINQINAGLSAQPPISHRDVWETKADWNLLRRHRLRALIDEVCRPALLVRGPTYFVATAAVVKGPVRAASTRAEYDMMGTGEPGLHIFQFGPTHSSPPEDARVALQSTSALPWLYGPIRHHEDWLSDGGLLANLPGDIIKSLNVDAFVVVSPKDPTARLSSVPISRRIELNMRRRLSLLMTFAAAKKLGPVPVYHLHPGQSHFQPPGILNFGRSTLQEAFANGYEFGQTLTSWTHASLRAYAAQQPALEGSP